MTKLAQEKIYLDAEIVDDSSFQEYDNIKIQDRIEAKDGQLELFSVVGKTSILAGCQLVAVQSLYTAGVSGFLPGAIAFLPVLGSVGGMMTNVRLQGWLPVPEDKNKIIPSAIRTSVLLGQATKLCWDAHQRETLAEKSFTQIAAQERINQGLKPQSGIGWEVVVVGIFAVLILFKIGKKIMDYAVSELDKKTYSKTTLETLLGVGSAVTLGALIWANIGDGIAKKDICFSPNNKTCKADTIGIVPASYWEKNKSKTANPNYNEFALLESKNIKITRELPPDNPWKIQLGLFGIAIGAGILTGSEKLKDKLESERPHYRASKKLEGIRANVGLKTAEELLNYSSNELIKYIKCLKSADAKRELVQNITPYQQTILLLGITKEEYHEYGYLLDMGKSFDKFGAPILTPQKEEAIAPTEVINNDLWIDSFLSSSCLCWGNQGSGKSWFVRELVRRKVEKGYEVVVLDPNSNKFEWQGVRLINDYTEIENFMREYVDEVMGRYKEFGQSNISEEEWRNNLWKDGKAITVVVEEMSTYGVFIEDKELLNKFAKVAMTLSRKQEMPCVFVTHNNTQSCLGDIKGLANVVAAMQQIQLLATTNPTTKQPVASSRAMIRTDGATEWFEVAVPKISEKIRNFTKEKEIQIAENINLDEVKKSLERTLDIPMNEEKTKMSEQAIALLKYLVRNEKTCITVAELQPNFKIDGERFKVGELRIFMQEICDAGKGKWEDGKLTLE